MSLKFSPNIKIPDYGKETQADTRGVFEQIIRLIVDAFRNIYDDLNGLTPGRGASLPTAGVDYLGKFYIKTNAGALDDLNICLYDGSSSTYKWKKVGVS